LRVEDGWVWKHLTVLDEVLEAWEKSPLGEVKVLYLDARYGKVCLDGQIRDAAILITSGVIKGGKRQIFGVFERS